MRYNKNTAEMTCAYCGERMPWTSGNFPNHMYAECVACLALHNQPKRRWWQRVFLKDVDNG